MMSVCPAKEKEEVIAYFKDRFGIEDSAFAGYSFYDGGKGRIYLGPLQIPARPPAVCAGLTIARMDEAVKPTTNILQLWGDRIKKNFVSVGKEKALKFMNGEDITVSGNEVEHATDGYVVIRYLDFSLGCGLLKVGKIKNMLPKVKRLVVKHL